ALASGFAIADLHHAVGHDPQLRKKSADGVAEVRSKVPQRLKKKKEAALSAPQGGQIERAKNPPP
ncbi:MAG: hypothetical protein E5Y79_25280, partial [Mesorhizobium sp.]|uniref:hypothetical protein n=1 Tax=Mesorhizobium sp. TaxID=1871066 RepID=UPI001213239A